MLHVDHTFPPSVTLVNMTIVESLCSQIILQKSPIVFGIGPWAAMYAFGRSYPYKDSRQKLISCHISCLVTCKSCDHVWCVRRCMMRWCSLSPPLHGSRSALHEKSHLESREREEWALIRTRLVGGSMNSHGEMFANLFLDLFLLAAVAGTLSSLGRVCDSMHEREREKFMSW